MLQKLRSRLAVAFGASLPILVAGVLVRWQFEEALGQRALYSTFFPSVIVAAYFGGFWPGIVITLLATIAANASIYPQLTLQLKGTGDTVAMLLFVVTGVIISVLSGLLHRAHGRILAEERRRSAEARRESEDRFRQIVENIQEIFWITDATTDQFLFVSPVHEQIYGRKFDYSSKSADIRLESVHPDDRAAIERSIRDRKRGVFETVEYRIVRPDGEIRWLRSRAFPVHDADGKIKRIAGLAADITDLKRSEKRFRTFVDHASDAFFLFDENNVVLDVNDVACERLGYTRQELIGMTPERFDSVVDKNTLDDINTNLLAGGAVAFESRHRRKDGTSFPVEIRARSFWEGGNRFTVGLARDISERKFVEQQLRRAKDLAEGANRAKDEFLANVSHEIRTPMNAILGMTELVLDAPLADEQRRRLRTVKSAADNLLGIINDLLDFSKIEAGKLSLDITNFSLRSVIADTLVAMAVRAEKKGLTLTGSVDADVPDSLAGDPGRLRQVLLNLVGNAIKFTHAGQVVVSVQNQPHILEKLAPAQINLQFIVRDTGIGIPKEKQELIFHAFEQEDTSTTRKYGGTGLGLTIAAQLAALMGGGITVESEPGRGSTFTFSALFALQPDHAPTESTAPAMDPRPETSADIAKAIARALRVLVAEDSEFNAQLMEALLGKKGHTVQIAGTGTEALRLAITGDFDLLLLDLHMPELDGFDVIHAIREKEKSTGSHLPAIALTARARPEDRQRCLDAGVDDFLSKPLQVDLLWSTIDRVLSAHAANSESLLSPQVLLAACGHEESLLQTICNSLARALPQELTALATAWQNQNLQSVGKLAHKISGMVGAFSTPAALTASQLEDAAFAGRSDDAHRLVQKIQSQAQSLTAMISGGLTVESLKMHMTKESRENHNPPHA